jgi:hypothetical protein
MGQSAELFDAKAQRTRRNAKNSGKNGEPTGSAVVNRDWQCR